MCEIEIREVAAALAKVRPAPDRTVSPGTTCNAGAMLYVHWTPDETGESGLQAPAGTSGMNFTFTTE